MLTADMLERKHGILADWSQRLHAITNLNWLLECHNVPKSGEKVGAEKVLSIFEPRPKAVSGSPTIASQSTVSSSSTSALPSAENSFAANLTRSSESGLSGTFSPLEFNQNHRELGITSTTEICSHKTSSPETGPSDTLTEKQSNCDEIVAKLDSRVDHDLVEKAKRLRAEYIKRHESRLDIY
ncbi:unnamed protein product [Protopolystoma xenopodis]|uniref:Uncharacterized protein n=1 Tax=Protopolystoma xenopodis TaxID=117903 RepID=A0A3S5BB39_9PLAT|nr:unnamed protein product [Protopolystoma xenopodis]